MTRGKARLTLTYTWWVWGVVLFALITLFSVLPASAAASPDIWPWFLPNILPVLTLVGAASYRQGSTRRGAGRPPGRSSRWPC